MKTTVIDHHNLRNQSSSRSSIEIDNNFNGNDISHSPKTRPSSWNPLNRVKFKRSKFANEFIEGLKQWKSFLSNSSNKTLDTFDNSSIDSSDITSLPSRTSCTQRRYSLASITHLHRKTVKDLEKLYEKMNVACEGNHLASRDIFSTVLCPTICASFISHIFDTLDNDKSDMLDIRRIFCGLVQCCRGTVEEKLTFSFHLYTAEVSLGSDNDGDSTIRKCSLTTEESADTNNATSSADCSIITEILPQATNINGQSPSSFKVNEVFEATITSELVMEILQSMRTVVELYNNLYRLAGISNSSKIQDYSFISLNVDLPTTKTMSSSHDDDEITDTDPVERMVKHMFHDILPIDRISLSQFIYWMMEHKAGIEFTSLLLHVAYIDVVPRPDTPNEERLIVQSLLRESSQMRVGDTWYICSFKWWSLWSEYVQLDNSEENVNGDDLLVSTRINKDTLPSTLSSAPYSGPSSTRSSFTRRLTNQLSRLGSREPKDPTYPADQQTPIWPGVIDNSALVSSSDDNADVRSFIQLRSNLVNNVDFVLLPEPIWNILFSWYGAGPVLPRQVVGSVRDRRSGSESSTRSLDLSDHRSISISSLQVELYPLVLWIESPVGAPGRKETIVCSKKNTVSQLVASALHKLGILSMPRSYVRLWNIHDKMSPKLLVQDDTSLEDARVMNGQHLIIDVMQTDGVWSINIPKTEREFMVPNIDPEYRGDGLVGLSNLGNTCFMNAALQCLFNTSTLREYFLSNMYLKEINTSFGKKGEICRQYAALIKQIWSTKSRASVAPRSFKSAIGKCAPRFSGTEQHDAQELCILLLDCIHEELNRVTKKPYIELRDSDGRPDDEVADEQWRNHLRRDQSIVVALFEGQLKSSLRCSKCFHENVRFDPYIFLTLPIPESSKCFFNIVFIDECGNSFHSREAFNISSSTVADVRESVARSHKLSVDEVVMAEIQDHYIFTLIPDNKALQRLTNDDVIYAYRVRMIMSFELSADSRVSLEAPFLKSDSPTSLVQIVHGHLQEARASFSVVKRKLFGTPMLLKLPYSASSIQLFAAIEACFPNYNGKYRVRYTNRNASSCGCCTWTKFCLGCEIVRPSTSCSTSTWKSHIGNSGESVNLIVPLDLETVVLDWEDDVDFTTLKGATDSSKSASMTIETAESPLKIEDCIHEFCKEEVLGTKSDDSKPYCSNCKASSSHSKLLSLWSAPPVLVIHLKRFRFTKHRRFSKVTSLVDFKLKDWDISKYLLCPNRRLSGAVTTALDALPPIYDLYAVVNHFGGYGGGHYIAQVYNEHYKKWICFDDSNAYFIDEKACVSKAAYMLFYVQKGYNLSIALPVMSDIISSLNESIATKSDGNDTDQNKDANTKQENVNESTAAQNNLPTRSVACDLL